MSRSVERGDDGTRERAGEALPDPAELVVIVGTSLTTFRLPAAGSVSIGRSDDNDLRIDDGSVSRRHAVLHLGPPARIEDLGSANGIRLCETSDQPRTAELHNTKLRSDKSIFVRVGDSIGLGAATLVLRRAEAPAGPPIPAQEGRFVVRDEAMRRLHELAGRVAGGNISVLLLGETGVGKEVLAEVIHTRSPRAAGPFLKLNCAALSETLLESELFGHERGSFTGASQQKHGLLETADRGTVFLDEVGELPMPTQVKLLRVLEERKVTRVGGLAPRDIDVRFVSATNRDLAAEARRGTFRQDLYFRLNGITLTIPPLRERTSEIGPLARAFAARAAASMGRAEPVLSRDVLDALERHSWPGNVRELRNVMDRAVVLAGGSALHVDHLLIDAPPPSIARIPGAAVIAQGPPSRGRRAASVTTPALPAAATATGARGLQGEIESLERQRILDALNTCAGNQTQAAAMLGMPRRTFVARLDEYGIPRPRKKTL